MRLRRAIAQRRSEHDVNLVLSGERCQRCLLCWSGLGGLGLGRLALRRGGLVCRYLTRYLGACVVLSIQRSHLLDANWMSC